MNMILQLQRYFNLKNCIITYIHLYIVIGSRNGCICIHSSFNSTSDERVS